MKQMKDLKRFSKEWWTNYWFYYKWHTIAGIFVVILAIGTIVDVVTRVKPDIDILFASQYAYSDENIENMKAEISNIIDDINNDGAKTVQLATLYTSIEPKDEMQVAALQKLDLEFAAGDSFIFIMDKPLFERSDGNDLFVELKDGKNYILAKEVFDFLNEDMVICVRVQRSNEKADYSNTQKLLDTLIK